MQSDEKNVARYVATKLYYKGKIMYEFNRVRQPGAQHTAESLLSMLYDLLEDASDE
jgi:hypothetical protein